MKTLNVWGICAIEAPRSEVLISHVILWIWSFCRQEQIHGWWSPCESRRRNRVSISFFTTSDKSPCTISHWVSAGSTLIPRVFLDVPSMFHVSSSMYQVGGFGRGSASHKDLERLPVDWERGIIFHCKSILHLEILWNHPNDSLFPVIPVFVNGAPV